MLFRHLIAPCLLHQNSLWYDKPGQIWSRHFLPVANGYLAAMTPGGTTQEITQLNIESLWSGGPFADSSYNGGNKQPSEQDTMASAMQQIRQTIFKSPIGEIDNIDVLTTDSGAYGSYASAGNLITTLALNGEVSDYARWLDLDAAVARTRWSQAGFSFFRELFCVHPTRTCTQRTAFAPRTAANAQTLPNVTYAFAPLSLTAQGMPVPSVTCFDAHTLRVAGNVASPGMAYELLARVGAAGGSVACAPGLRSNATITVSGAREAWVTWVGGTEYDLGAGDAAHGFSFRGAHPHDGLVELLKKAPQTPEALLAVHAQDVETTLGAFSLSLDVPQVNMEKTTAARLEAYRVDEGDVYLEGLLFNYGRYLLWSSARGVLPANLQGKWAEGYANAWSADYHANINVQMNYWAAETTGLDVMSPLFNYIEKSWAPRGTLTARALYNASRGWVTHNEMNVFGHTGMKAGGPGSAEWGNYPESAVWMMMHVWDRFDFGNDVAWWRAQGWPLIKGVAQFHLDKLIPDLYFGDGTLVVSPCNSPEQAPITFGCAHAQQMIWQLFNAVEKGFDASGDSDVAFLAEVKAKRAQMDKGLRIGSWGQLQEWKVEKDSPTDTHRHLSHLVGLYPGYAIASYDPALQGRPQTRSPAYFPAQVTHAATVSLAHRGNGTGPDADAGWEKVWRAAGWAQLQDAARFYHVLTYALYEDFGANLFSLYNPGDPNPIFQIDANLGYPAAVMNALIQAPDVPTSSTPLTITLLPALPRQWAAGSVRGARVRGGIGVDMRWDEGRVTWVTLAVDSQARTRPVRVVGNGRVLAAFTTVPGTSRSLPV